MALLLAGGHGVRLNILAARRAKPAVPFAGSYRIIDFTLSNIMHANIPRVGILTQYRPTSLMEHIGDGSSWGFNEKFGGLKMLPPYLGREDSDWYKGTADAVHQNILFIRNFNPSLVLIASGDHIYKMDYRSMINYHAEKKAEVTIAGMRVPFEDIARFGIMITDTDLRVKEFIEKKADAPSNLASMGVYVFNSDVLLEELETSVHASGYDFGRDMLPRIAKSRRIFCCLYDGYWRDVGTIDSYWNSSMDILDPQTGLNLTGWRVRTNDQTYELRYRTPPKAGKNAEIINSMVSRGCRINGKVINSILSPGVCVEKGSVVTDSVLLHDVIVKHGGRIDRVIADKNVIIGENSVTGYGEVKGPNIRFPEHLQSGITVIGKDAVVPEKTRIGRNCIIMPGITESSFREKEIPSREVVS
jgi:glucose-1-phosphate adenylyltransferase